MKKYMAVVTAKNSYSFFYSKKKDKCIIQDDIKRSVFHRHVNGN